MENKDYLLIEEAKQDLDVEIKLQSKICVGEFC